MLMRMILFGIIIGVLSVIFIRFVTFVEKLFEKIKVYPPIKGIIGGVLIILIIFITGTTDYLGIGEQIINNAVKGYSVRPVGNLWASIVSGSVTFYAAVGMVAFMATCANTPIAGIVMCMELFGSEVGIYAAVVCVVGYLIVGHKSIYPTQILAKSKTPSLYIDTNSEIFKAEKNIKVKNKFFKKEN